jgi:hypothetical protein
LHGEQGVGGAPRNKTIEILQKFECNQLERPRAQASLLRVLLASIEARFGGSSVLKLIHDERGEEA